LGSSFKLATGVSSVLSIQSAALSAAAAARAAVKLAMSVGPNAASAWVARHRNSCKARSCRFAKNLITICWPDLLPPFPYRPKTAIAKSQHLAAYAVRHHEVGNALLVSNLRRYCVRTQRQQIG